MSDQAYGTQSGGGQEGGTSNASDQEISAQEDSQSEGQELQSNERYITKEELEARIGEVMRSAQSMTDKMGSRLDKEIQSALKQANDSIELTKQAGIKYTPEQEQAIRDRAINSAYTRLNQSQESPPPVSGQPKARPQQEQGGQQVNPGVWINQEVARIMRDTGVYIPPEEANELIVGENKDMTPYQYIQAFESLARQRQSNSSQPRGPSPAIPSYVTGGKSPNSQSALRQAFDKEMAQIRKGQHPTLRRGDTMGIQNLEIEYRKKGLDI